MQEKNGPGPSIPSGTQMQFPLGTNFSTNNNEITTNGITYVAYGPGGPFLNWKLNDSPTTSGQIVENSTLSALFGPP